MALPSNLATRTVTGTYVDLSGVPAVGIVTFATDTVLTDVGAAVVIIPRVITAELDPTGHFSVVLPVTNDPDVTPQFVYKVTEQFEGLKGRSFTMDLPSGTTPIDISTVAIGGTPPPPVVGYATSSQLASEQSSRISGDANLQTQINQQNFNVMRYGATGNRVDDDRPAIQAAIDAASAAGGGTVYLPGGGYAINSPIVLKSNVNLVGEGDVATEIVQVSSSNNCITGDNLLYCTIRGLRITGPASGTGKGIAITGQFDFCRVEDVTVTDFGGTGISIEQPIVTNFTRVISQWNGGDGFYLYGNASGGGTSITMSSCWAHDNAGNGYSLYNMTYCSFVASAADNQTNAGTAGYLFNVCSGMALTGCGSEGNKVGVKFNSGGNHTVSGFFNYANPAGGIGFWIATGATNVHLTGIAESLPNAGATAWVQADSGTSVTIRGSAHTTADSLAAGTTVSVVNSAGVQVIPDSTATGKNTTLGSQSPLGDNGVGVTQIANAATVPTTNPTGGVTLYSESTTPLPLKIRDPSGSVRSLVDGYASVAANETSTGATTQKASTALKLAVQANATYLLEAAIIFSNTSAAASFGASWTGPTGATLKWNDTGTSGDYLSTIGGVNSYSGSTANRMAFFKGKLVVGGTAGNLTFTFSTSDAAQTSTLLADSWMTLTRVK